jgi:hypothetical protein
VLGYSWAVFTMYLQQARIQEAERRATDLVIANQAFAGGDGAKKLLDALHRQAEER